MTKDEVLDALVKRLSNGDTADGIALIKALSGIRDHNTAQTIFDLAKAKNLIQATNPRGNWKLIKISIHGKEIQDSGGWLHHLKTQSDDKSEERRGRKIQIEKDSHQLTLAKWQKWVFWPITITALIGGIMGALAFFGIHFSK